MSEESCGAFAELKRAFLGAYVEPWALPMLHWVDRLLCRWRP